MGIDEDFAEFVSARWSSLYRLAYLLAASPTGAEDLLQTTLEKAYVNWARIGQMEYAEAYVRRMLANALVSSRRRAWTREQPSDRLPETWGDSEEMPVLDRSLLWPLICALPSDNAQWSCCATTRISARPRSPTCWGARPAR